MSGRYLQRPRDRMIGARLRAVRTERAGLLLEDAARVLGISAATMSRAENGLRHITSEEVATLVTAYGLPARRASRVHRGRTLGQPLLRRGTDTCPACLSTPCSPATSTRRTTLTDWSVSLVPTTPPGRGLRTRGPALGRPLSRKAHGAAGEQPGSSRTGSAPSTTPPTSARPPYTGPLVDQPSTETSSPTSHSLQDRGIGLRIVPEHLPVGVVSHSWLYMTLLQHLARRHCRRPWTTTSTSTTTKHCSTTGNSPCSTRSPCPQSTAATRSERSWKSLT